MSDQTAEQKLAAIASIVAGTAPAVPQPGPGIAPSVPTVLPWFVDRSKPLPPAPLPTCYDNPETAKWYAAFGINAGGVRCVAESDLPAIDALCRKLYADTITAEQANNLLDGAGYMDVDAAIYAARTGWMQNFPVGAAGGPSLFTVKGRLADLIAKPGVSGGGPGIAG